MTFLLNGKPVDALALIVHKSAQVKVAQVRFYFLGFWVLEPNL